MLHSKKSYNELDIDIRFLLANERTLLAWVRTGLTLIAGGVALAFISNDSTGALAGIGAIVFGGLLALIGYIRYRAADAAIRAGKLPATGFGGMLVVAGVIVFAVILIVVKRFELL